MKKIHKDKLDRELKLGDVVCYPTYNDLRIGRIIKINPNMLAIINLESHAAAPARVYSKHTIRLDGPDTMIWILVHSK